MLDLFIPLTFLILIRSPYLRPIEHRGCLIFNQSFFHSILIKDRFIFTKDNSKYNCWFWKASGFKFKRFEDDFYSREEIEWPSLKLGVEAEGHFQTGIWTCTERFIKPWYKLSWLNDLENKSRVLLPMKDQVHFTLSQKPIPKALVFTDS